jgi:hypothetical protein
VNAFQILLGIVLLFGGGELSVAGSVARSLLLADGGVPGTEAGPMSRPSLPIRVAGSQNPA